MAGGGLVRRDAYDIEPEQFRARVGKRADAGGACGALTRGIAERPGPALLEEGMPVHEGYERENGEKGCEPPGRMRDGSSVA